MARPPKDLKQPIPYTPAPPPVPGTSQQDLTRAVWDELRRIAEALSNPPAP